jgi:hypothetical protein
LVWTQHTPFPQQSKAPNALPPSLLWSGVNDFGSIFDKTRLLATRVLQHTHVKLNIYLYRVATASDMYSQPLFIESMTGTISITRALHKLQSPMPQRNGTIACLGYRTFTYPCMNSSTLESSYPPLVPTFSVALVLGLNVSGRGWKDHSTHPIRLTLTPALSHSCAHSS